MRYKIVIYKFEPNRDPQKEQDPYFDQLIEIYEQSTEKEINLKNIIDAFNGELKE